MKKPAAKKPALAKKPAVKKAVRKKTPAPDIAEETAPKIEPAQPVEDSTGEPIEKEVEKKRLGLAARLKALLAREIADIEARGLAAMDEGDKEKIARRLSSLVRSFDKLAEIERVAKAGKKKRTVYGEKEHAAMRDELERRLDKLAAETGAASVSQ